MNKHWADSGEYRKEVRDDVESAIKNCGTPVDLNDPGWRDNEDLSTALEDISESTNMDFATSFQVMEFTGNDNAYYEEHREWPQTDDWFNLVTQVATSAYTADLKDCLRDMLEEDAAIIIGAVQCEECDTWREKDVADCSTCNDRRRDDPGDEDEDEDEDDDSESTKDAEEVES